MKKLLFALLLALVLSTSAYALSISNVQVNQNTANTATITWQTDQLSSSRIRYGVSASLGFSRFDSSMVTNHQITLTGLQPDTTYYFEVVSVNTQNVQNTSDNNGNKYTFKTRDVTAPPQVFGLRALESTPNSTTISWNNVSASDVAFFRIYQAGSFVANSTSLALTLGGLQQNTEYTFRVSAVDDSGNEGILSSPLSVFTTVADVTAPALFAIDIVNITDTSLAFVWQSDEMATSAVVFGTGTDKQSINSSILAQSHGLTLFNLQTGSTYTYVLRSCDRDANCATINGTFVAGRDTAPPKINVSIPEFVNRRAIDIFGSTEPFSEVKLFVNDFNSPLRFLGSSEVGPSGRIAFRSILLQPTNTIKIVSTDRSGNVAEQFFSVTVDTDEPILVLKSFPLITSGKNLTISGTVNEAVVLSVFVRSSAEKEQALKTIGALKASAAENMVSLSWPSVDDKDFSHYVLRRDDVGPIALLHPASYTGYTDILVDAGKTYSYTVSYVNKFGTESAQSNALKVTVPSSGIFVGIKPARVETHADFSAAHLQINVSPGDFVTAAQLGSDDGSYTIKIQATDIAGNLVVFSQKVEKDSKVPDIKLISPPQNALVFENYADEVDIKGTTEPGATVHLYLNRAPFQCKNTTIEIPRLLSDIAKLPDSELKASSKFGAKSVAHCPPIADMSTTADGSGHFIFEDVNLASTIALAGAISEVPIDQNFQSTAIRQTKKTTFVLIATDKAQLRSALKSEVTIGNCWSGNVTWDVIPLAEYQTPSLLSTERLAENTESIYFYFNYSYIGRGAAPKIISVGLTKACGTVEVLDKRFNTSCRLLPGGANAQPLNPPENTVTYQSVKLNRLDGMDTWAAAEWKGFFNTFSKELTFPFMLTITYSHEVEGKRVTETQTTCQEVSYALDNSRVDPRKVLPDWLLYDFVSLLNSSIAKVKEVQHQIDMIMPYVANACLVSYGANFGTGVWRRWQETFTEKSIVVKNALNNAFETFGGGFQSNDYCKNLVKMFINSGQYGNGLSFKLNWLSDGDLKKCFPEISAAWELEANSHQAYRYSCDRLFGHSAPSKWTQTKSDQELVAKSQQGNSCSNDKTPRGQPIRRARCMDLIKESPIPGLSKPDYSPDQYCLAITQKDANNKDATIIYLIGEQLDGTTRLTKITSAIPGKTGFIPDYVIQSTTDTYLAPQSKTCDQVCRGVTTGFSQPSSSGSRVVVGSQEFVSNNVGAAQQAYKEGICMTAQRCNNYNSPQKQFIPSKDGKNKILIDRTERLGFTSDCFYGAQGIPNSYSVVGDELNQRYECCCMYEKGASGPVYPYYSSNDLYLDQSFYGNDEFTEQISPIHKQETEVDTANPAYTPIEWSYRYSKIKFQARDQLSGALHTEYNPYRYIDDRDFPACFGQNAWLQDENILILDPAKQHLSAIQCVNLGGIQSRLTMITNIMSAMQTCLIQVRTTGRADTGACKELFTQHVCSMTWDAIQWFLHTTNGNCVPGGLGVSSGNANEDSIINYLKGGLKGITEGINDQQNQFMQDYGNVKANSIFGASAEETARKVCLAAFGYEWPLSAKALLDASYSQPFATLVQGITASRDLLTVEPKTGQAMMEYRASWLINPGCDFSNYKVELACIGRDTLDSKGNSLYGSLPLENGADCTKQRSPDGVNCPCLDIGEKVQPFFSSGGSKLKQNQLEEKADHKVIQSPYRFDHLKITLNPDARTDPKLRSRCFPTGYERGVFYFPITDRTAKDLLNCRIEPASGVFMCNSGLDYFSRKGFAYLTDTKINDRSADQTTEVLTGQPLRVSTTLFKAGDDKCLRISLNGGIKLPGVVWPIVINGTSTFSELVVPQVEISSVAQQDIVSLPWLSAQKEGMQSLTQPVNIDVKIARNPSRTDQSGTFDRSLDYLCIEDGAAQCTESNKIQFTGSPTVSKNGLATITANTEGTVIVEKQGARVILSNFNFAPPQSSGVIPAPQPQSGVLRVMPAGQQGETQQQVTMEIGLYNMVEKRSNVFSPADCNFNELAISPQGDIQKRTYNFLIRSVASAQNNLVPVLTGQTITPNPLSPQGEGTISVRVTQRPEITIENVSLLSMDDSSSPIYQRMDKKQTDKDTTIYETKITAEQLTIAGTYSLGIVAQYKLPGKDATITTQPLRFSASVACNQLGYAGTCRPKASCNTNYVIVNPERACYGQEVCCSSTPIQANS